MTRSIRTTWLTGALTFVVGIVGCTAETTAPAVESGPNPDGGRREDGGAPPQDGSIDPPTRATNEPPTARGETYYTSPDTAVTLAGLLENDTDPDGDPLTLVVTREPTHGTLARTDAGSYVYTPNQGYIGEDVFAYSVGDAHGATDATEAYVYAARRTYYVSPSGDDANGGTSPTSAWQSVGKVVGALCAGTIMGGDVVLFERGARFYETLTNCNRHGVLGAPIVFGAYGSGAPPALTGGVAVTGWTRHAGNIWRATLPRGVDPVSDVYVDGARQQPARLPNTGWFRSGAGDSGTPNVIVTPDLAGGHGAYVGATLRVRTRNWSYETARVTASSPGRLTVDPAPSDIHTGGWGYFIDGQLALLDTDNEWFYDDASRTLYLDPPGDGDPSAVLVEATVRPRAVDLTINDGAGDWALVVDDLAIEHARAQAVQVYDPGHASSEVPHLVLRRVAVADAQQGIKVIADNVDIVETFVTRTLGVGVSLGERRGRLLRSTVSHIAVSPGYGESVWGYMGVQTYGDDWVIRHNIIDDVGYIGINAEGARGIVEENVVTHSLAILNDGGGIAFDHVSDLLVRRNIVADTISAYLETVSESAGPWISPYARLNLGIAYGNTSIANAVVEGNVVAHNAGGIAADHTANSSGNTVRDNLVFDGPNFLLAITDQARPECTPTFDDIYTGNVLVPGSADDAPHLFIQDVQCPALVQWGTFDDNLYATIYGDLMLHRENHTHAELTRDYTMPDWQAESGQDSGSSETAPSLGLPASAHPIIHYNTGRGPRVVALSGTWRRLDGTLVMDTITIDPYHGVVLLPE